jgi:hypothetical protein
MLPKRPLGGALGRAARHADRVDARTMPRNGCFARRIAVNNQYIRQPPRFKRADLTVFAHDYTVVRGPEFQCFGGRKPACPKLMTGSAAIPNNQITPFPRKR